MASGSVGQAARIRVNSGSLGPPSAPTAPDSAALGEHAFRKSLSLQPITDFGSSPVSPTRRLCALSQSVATPGNRGFFLRHWIGQQGGDNSEKVYCTFKVGLA
jgi:hypothetical protein